MRLFYDRYTTRRQGDFWLLAADVLASVSVILFASRICYQEARGEEALLLAIWAATPRCVARYFEWLHKPRDFTMTLLFSGLFVLGCLSLVLVGVDLLWESALPSERMMQTTMLFLLLTWFSGFLLYAPPWYRVHDALLGFTLVLALFEHAPQPLLWVPLALLGMCLSQTIRHQLVDVFRGVPEPPLNLQNARTAGGLAAIAAAVLFATVFAVTYPWLDYRAEPSLEEGEDEPMSLVEAAFGRPEPRPELRRYREGYRGSGGGGDRPGRPGVSEIPGIDGSQLPPGLPPTPTSRSGLQPRLQQNRFHQDDARVVLVVHPLDRTAWRPTRGTLWRARSYSRFDPDTLIWRSSEAPVPRSWPDTRTVDVGDGTAGRSVELAIEIINPAFAEALIAPYTPLRWGPILRTPSDEFYYRGPLDDLYPAPPFITGSTYLVRFRPGDPGPQDFARVPRGTRAPERVYREVVSAERLGIDLRERSDAVLGRTGSLQICLDRLRRYWERFRYSETYASGGDVSEIVTFLEERKVGSCLHFATVSALLLRHAGFSTRLAVGFLGGEVVPTDGTVVVKAETAHAWVEVYAGSAGWLPVDPTAWVPLDPSASPPTGPMAGAEPAEGAGVAPGASGAGEAPVGDDAVAGEPGTPEPVPDIPAPAGGSELPPGISRWLDDRDVPIDERIRQWQSAEDARRTREAATSPSDPRSTEPTAEEIARSKETKGSPARAKSARRSNPRQALLRLALVVIGALAVFLAVASILRPRPVEKSDDEDEEDEGPPEPLGGPQIAAPDFEPTNPREEVLHAYHLLQLELAWTRQHRRRHETPIEHSRRFWGRDDALDLALSELVHQVYDALFASREIGDKEVTVARQACDVVRKHLS